MGGVGAEVAKNIILGGVKSVKLMDDAVVSELDASAQFLVPREAVGQNVSHLTIDHDQCSTKPVIIFFLC